MGGRGSLPTVFILSRGACLGRAVGQVLQIFGVTAQDAGLPLRRFAETGQLPVEGAAVCFMILPLQRPVSRPIELALRAFGVALGCTTRESRVLWEDRPDDLDEVAALWPFSLLSVLRHLAAHRQPQPCQESQLLVVKWYLNFVTADWHGLPKIVPAALATGEGAMDACLLALKRIAALATVVAGSEERRVLQAAVDLDAVLAVGEWLTPGSAGPGDDEVLALLARFGGAADRLHDLFSDIHQPN